MSLAPPAAPPAQRRRKRIPWPAAGPATAAPRGPGPCVIGGTGGSGTRVFARLVRHAGLFIGTRLNVSEDPVDFIAFWDRWVNPFVLRERAPLPPEGEAEMRRQFEAALARHCAPLGEAVRPWGWKAPRSIFLLPFLDARFRGLRFLHVVRDGRDMAYVSEPKRLTKHASAVLDPDELHWSRPLQLITAWSRINLQAAEYGERRLGDRYRFVRFEDLCAEPGATIRRVFDFFGLASDAELLAGLEVAPPESLGRWRQQDARTVAALERLGEPALRKFGYWDAR